MFRLEAYITGIILNYVDRYCKSFRREDAQLSLWEGDAILQNLELDLEVLEQELNIPFSFTSGHIHELHIHVPWTRLTSAPVQIVINTIECVMRLKPPGTPTPKPKRKKKPKPEESTTPPGYVNSLVNKIVCNISVTCNNLILKYVEEDIVLSMNIKTGNVSTVNSEWIREFSEVTPTQLISRKLINLTDITVCLDEQNNAGRIESYLEPLLFKCSLDIRLSRSFRAINSPKPYSTRVGIHCSNVNLSISHPQVSMLLRLILITKMAWTPCRSPSTTTTMSSEEEMLTEPGGASWSSYLWGLIPYIILSYPIDERATQEPDNLLHVGCYIDNCELDFKLVPDAESKNWESMLRIILGGLFAQMSSNGKDWRNFQFGICAAQIVPVPGVPNEMYLMCGKLPLTKYSRVLYDKPDEGLPQLSWDQHLTAHRESIMLERAPTISIDYLTTLNPYFDDDNEEIVRNREKSLLRCVVGSVVVNICARLIQQLSIFQDCIKENEELMNIHNSTISTHEIVVPADMNEYVDNFVPQVILQLTAFGPELRLYPLEKMHLSSRRNVNKLLVNNMEQHPYLMIRANIIDGQWTRPASLEKVKYLQSKSLITHDMKEACKTELRLVLEGVCSAVFVKEFKGKDNLNIGKFVYELTVDHLARDKDDENIAVNYTARIEDVTLEISKPKMLLTKGIVESAINHLNGLPIKSVYDSSLLYDCINMTDLVYFTGKIHKSNFTWLENSFGKCVSFDLDHVAMFGSQTRSRDHAVEVSRILSTNTETKVVECVVQLPRRITSNSPPVICFSIRNIDLSMEPVLYLWALYVPQVVAPRRSIARFESSGSALGRKVSTSSYSSLPKKVIEYKESVEVGPVQKVQPSKSVSPSPSNSDQLMGLGILSMVISGELKEIRCCFPSSAPKNSRSNLVATLPLASIHSAQGPIKIKTLACPLSRTSPRFSAPSFPWTVLLLDLQCYTLHQERILLKLPIVHPFSISCTVAVTSKMGSNPLMMMSSLSVGLHVDTSAVKVALCQLQLSHIVNVLACLNQVYNAIGVRVDDSYMVQITPAGPPTTSTQHASTSSESSPSQVSVLPPSHLHSGGPESKFNCCIQWTLAKCVVSFYNNPPNSPSSPVLKINCELEDIFMTLDSEKVYQKLKLRVGTATIAHYIKNSQESGWCPGSFCGLIMRAYDPDSKSSNNNSHFLSVVVMRVNAADYHTKRSSGRAKLPCHLADEYIMEVNMQLQPLDFILPPTILRHFYGLAHPFMYEWMAFPLGHRYAPTPLSGPSVYNYSTSNLPLLYFDLSVIRIFVPSTLGSCVPNYPHDSLFFQIENISLKSEAENPVSRKILRADLYASTQRSSSITDSCVADRQYQLDVSITLSTGQWQELEVKLGLNPEAADPGQNPAVYWNSAGTSPAGLGAGSPHLSPVLAPTTITLIIAPPILTTGLVVSGLNIELNLVSETELNLDTCQFVLLFQLLEELKSLPDPSMDTSRNVGCGVDPGTDAGDSGVESRDGSERGPPPTAPKEMVKVAVRSTSVSQMSVSTTSLSTKRVQQRSQTVPVDILLTAKGFTFKLFSKMTDGSGLVPLFYLRIAEPHLCLEKQGDTSILKGSVFDIDVKHGAPGELLDGGKLTEDDFPVSLIQTRSGDIDPHKGVPPSLLNLKSMSQGIRSPLVELELSRPVQMAVSPSSIEYWFSIRDVLFSCLGQHIDVCQPTPRPVIPVFNQLRSTMQSYSGLQFTTKQISIILDPIEPGGSEVQLSAGGVTVGVSHGGCGGLSGCLRMTNLTVSQGPTGGPRALVLTPLSYCLTVGLDWPPWLPPNHPPYINLNLAAPVLRIHIYQPHLIALVHALSLYQELLESAFPPASPPPSDSKVLSSNTHSSPSPTLQPEEEEELYYRDDLQAGAFQFVTGVGSGNVADVPPLAYQVVFTSNAMAWTYPAPRLITGLTALPVPFQTAAAQGQTSPSAPVIATVQAWDGATWEPWTSFHLSETQHQAVPVGPRVPATSWRVLLPPAAPVPVQALAGSLRVDSLFSKKLIPSIRLTTNVELISGAVWTNFPSTGTLPPPFTRFGCDCRHPTKYSWAVGSITKTKLTALLWPTGRVEVEVHTKPKLEVVNWRTLELQPMVHPFSLNCRIGLEPSDLGPVHYLDTTHPPLTITLTANPVFIALCPATLQTAQSALQGALIAPYIVCNDSCGPLRFGQACTTEDISLRVLQAHLYAWRSTKYPFRLRFSVTEQGEYWSSPVDPWKAGLHELHARTLDGRTVKLLVHVKVVGQSRMVQVSGGLVIHNSLERELEVRVVGSNIQDRQRSLSLAPGSRSPGLLLALDSFYSLRIALEGHLSGLIPILSTTDSSWLVKVPLKGKQDYISVWCQVHRDTEGPQPRLLVMMGPIYLIRSYLPCDSNVIIETEELNTVCTHRLPGCGAVSNLLAPGTTAHSHALTFHIDGNVPSSTPHVPLSYSLLDGRTAPPPPTLTLDELLDKLEDKTPHWPPFLPGEWQGSSCREWAPPVQPDTVTNVKVRFGGEVGGVTHSLLVDLQPWALIANTLGPSLSLRSRGVTLCTIGNFTVLAPPPLEDTFSLAVDILGTTYMSPGLQLSISETFYIPTISGMIPLTGSVTTSIQTNMSVIYPTIHSKMLSGMRVLHISPTYVITNLSSFDFKVAPFLVRFESTMKMRLPNFMDTVFLPLPKQSGSNIMGLPLAEWHELGSGPEYHLYIILEYQGQLGTPLRVPVPGGPEKEISQALIPTSGAVANAPLSLVTLHRDNTVYLVVDDQRHPHLVLHNNTPHPLIVGHLAQENDETRVVEEIPGWDWKLTVAPGKSAYCLLTSAVNESLPPVVLAKVGLSPAWSCPISLTVSATGRHVHVPHLGYLTASVVRRGFTLHLTLAPASHSTISAQDIRARLLNLSAQSGSLPASPELEPREDSLRDPPTDTPCPQIENYDDLQKFVVAKNPIKIEGFLKGVTITLCSEADDLKWQEVLSASLENVAVSVKPFINHDDHCLETEIRIACMDIEVDNPEHSRGGYDFSVVLAREWEGPRQSMAIEGATLSNVAELVKKVTRESPALDLSVVMGCPPDTCVRDVMLKVAPLQAFVEDLYLTNLQEKLKQGVPSLLMGCSECAVREPAKDEEAPSRTCKQRLESSMSPVKEPKKEEAEVGDDELFNVSEEGSEDGLVEGVEVRAVGCQEEAVGEAAGPSRASPGPAAAPVRPQGPHIPLPPDLVVAALELARPLRLRTLSIPHTTLYVSLHTSTTFYIALDHSPLQLSAFTRNQLVTSPYRLGHAVGLHYLLAAIYGTGWALGSLQLLGAPAGLARSLGTGLRSFLALPAQGMMRGPAGFLSGVLAGSAALLQNVTAGTLSSLTLLAASWARTLDRLTLTEEELKLAEEARRLRPHTLGQALRQGLSEFGLSILGGVGALAHEPIQYMTSSNRHQDSLVQSLGRGLVGVISRPISGAADLVALTGQGILTGAGWTHTHLPRQYVVTGNSYAGVDSGLKLEWKLVSWEEGLWGWWAAVHPPSTMVLLVVSSYYLHLPLAREDAFLRPSTPLAHVSVHPHPWDPSALILTFNNPDTLSERLSRQRITEFLKSSQRALGSESAVMPSSPGSSPTEESITLLVNPKLREHVVAVVDLAIRHATGRGFPVYIP